VEKARFPIRALCRTLGVSSSGYYAWAQRPPSPRAARDRALAQRLRILYADHRRSYGSPRLQRALANEGTRVGRHRVMRLMRREGLRARPVRRFVVTTDSRGTWAPAPHRLAREFTAQRPHQRWVADLTYLPTRQGWLYLAVIVDLYARRVVGWATSARLTTDVALTALTRALALRRPPRGLVHHSDRGVQYACARYQATLTQAGARPSMSRRGNCYDNAVAESFFRTLKQELGPAVWPTAAAATHAVGDYIDHFYNPRRLHSTLGYQTPVSYEAACAS
jgi:putative transposase